MVWPYFIKLNANVLVLAKMAVQNPAGRGVDTFVLDVNEVKTECCAFGGECSKSGRWIGARSSGG
jgi:hypothetical protein